MIHELEEFKETLTLRCGHHFVEEMLHNRWGLFSDNQCHLVVLTFPRLSCFLNRIIRMSLS